jgi:hypothetical protein
MRLTNEVDYSPSYAGESRERKGGGWLCMNDLEVSTASWEHLISAAAGQRQSQTENQTQSLLHGGLKYKVT